MPELVCKSSRTEWLITRHHRLSIIKGLSNCSAVAIFLGSHFKNNVNFEALDREYGVALQCLLYAIKPANPQKILTSQKALPK